MSDNAVKEVLRGIVFLRRLADRKDFLEQVNCIPQSRMKALEAGLKRLGDEGIADNIQLGRNRFDPSPFTSYVDGVDAFFEKITGDPEYLTREPEPEFTGFDDVPELP